MIEYCYGFCLEMFKRNIKRENIFFMWIEEETNFLAAHNERENQAVCEENQFELVAASRELSCVYWAQLFRKRFEMTTNMLEI